MIRRCRTRGLDVLLGEVDRRLREGNLGVEQPHLNSASRIGQFNSNLPSAVCSCLAVHDGRDRLAVWRFHGGCSGFGWRRFTSPNGVASAAARFHFAKATGGGAAAESNASERTMSG
jgi:hypothetical protein